MTTATLERPPCGCPPKASTGPSVLGQRVKIMEGVTNSGAGGQRVHVGDVGNWAVGRVSQTVHIRPVEEEACSCCGITDTWNRTVASEWDTCDAGIAWVHSLGTGSSASVDGTRGVLTNGAGAGARATLPVVPAEAIMEATFEVELGALPSGDWKLLISALPGGLDHGSSDGYFTLFFGGPNAGIVAVGRDSTEETGSFTPSTGPWMIRVYADIAESKIKMWTGTEPAGWLVTNTEPWTAGSDSGIFYVQTSSSGVESIGAYFENLDIEGINSCVIDNFNRADQTGWGTATPAGFDYDYDPTGGSISSGRGLLSSDADQAGTNVPIPGYETALDVAFEFEFSGAGTATDALVFAPGNAARLELYPERAVLSFIGGDSPPDVEVTIGSLDEGVWVCHVYTDLTSLKVQIWGKTDTNPAAQEGWAGEISTASPTYDPNPLYLYWTILGSVPIYVDNLSRGDGCMFDNFSRTETGTWGNATPSGYEWYTAGSSGTVGVADGVGFCENGSLSADAAGSIDDHRWEGAFTMTSRFRYDTAPSNNQSMAFRFRVQDAVTGIQHNVILYLSTTVGDPPLLQLVDFNPGAGGDQTTSGEVDLPPVDTWIYVKWNYTPEGLERAKVWVEGDPEPDWMVSQTDVNAAQTNNQDFWVTTSPTYNLRTEHDYISFTTCPED